MAERESGDYSELPFFGDATTDYLAASSRNVLCSGLSRRNGRVLVEKNIEPVNDLMEICDRTDRLVGSQ